MVGSSGDGDDSWNAAVARAHAAWPAGWVPSASFVEHLRARLPVGRAPTESLPELAIEDLYLAFACALGVAPALEAFARTLLAGVDAHVARFDASASMANLLAEIDAAAAAGPARERSGRDDAASRSATRVHAPRRRRTALGAALALGAGALAVAILSTAHTGDPPCDAARLDGIWDAEVKARFAGASGPGAGRWASILRTIDTHTSEWIALREAACRKGSRIAENCLEQQLQQLRGVLAGLDVRDPKTAENAVSLLPKPSICADPGYLDALAAALTPTVRHSPGGLVPLAISFGGWNSDIIHAALEVDGDLVIAGAVTPGANFFGTQVDPSPISWRAGFLARIGDHGDVRWRWILKRAQVMAIAPVPGGDAVIAGYDAVGEAPGMTALPMIDAGADCFVARIDLAMGETRWRRTCFEAAMTVGEQELSRPVAADAFLLELSPTLAAPRGR